MDYQHPGSTLGNFTDLESVHRNVQVLQTMYKKKIRKLLVNRKRRFFAAKEKQKEFFSTLVF